MDPVEAWRHEALANLATVPDPVRNDDWYRAFDAAFWPAMLTLPHPWFYEDADGRPSLVLTLGDLAEGARPARPASLVDYLIQHRLGLILLDPAGNGVVGLPHGFVLSYRCYGRAFEPKPNVGAREKTIQPGDVFGLTSPLDPYFPPPVRDAIRTYMRDEFEIETPRAVIGDMPHGGRRIVLDFEPERLGETRVAQAFDGVRWLIPPRLAIARVDAWNRFKEMQPF